ncbi:hypothetical protein [Verrucomicrobium sp. GAS474]|uniref:hypothetical protein n=1 Tax=Verrucomicrobium sp. GAS474 TaxID=1882831 RepID=UPI000B874E03|nr:hypothetical protein [Verrucomicrobium sp. GAS474]
MRLPFVTSLTSEERSARIAARRQRSLFWRWVHRGASLNVAMTLLLTLGLACAAATITESRFNTDVARYYIYRNPLFLGWLAILFLNLFCVTLDRWPWQKRHLPFVITHYGIITLLLGAAVGSRFGYEAFMSLEKGGVPEGRVALNQNIVVIQGLRTGGTYEHPFSTLVDLPDASRPHLISVPEAPANHPLTLKIDGYATSLGWVESLAPDAQGGPGLLLRFRNGATGQEMPLVLLRESEAGRKRSFFGLASVDWVASFDAPAHEEKPTPTLQLLGGTEAPLRYRLLRGERVEKEGTLLSGTPLPLGWAEWQVTLESALPNARVEKTIAPTIAATAEANSGIRVALLDGEKPVSPSLWIPSGTSQDLPNPLNAEHPVRVGFGLQTKPLPFAVELVSFDVPRDEGGTTPSDFISTLRFYDLRGTTSKATAHMNYPATYPAGFWLSALGLNYKFSQANWDPDNLDHTTLQVLHDPGWPLKWVGSLLIVFGIASLFYSRTPSP